MLKQFVSGFYFSFISILFHVVRTALNVDYVDEINKRETSLLMSQLMGVMHALLLRNELVVLYFC